MWVFIAYSEELKLTNISKPYSIWDGKNEHVRTIIRFCEAELDELCGRNEIEELEDAIARGHDVFLFFVRSCEDRLFAECFRLGLRQTRKISLNQLPEKVVWAAEHAEIKQEYIEEVIAMTWFTSMEGAVTIGADEHMDRAAGMLRGHIRNEQGHDIEYNHLIVVGDTGVVGVITEHETDHFEDRFPINTRGQQSHPVHRYMIARSQIVELPANTTKTAANKHIDPDEMWDYFDHTRIMFFADAQGNVVGFATPRDLR
ncbi:MAG: hypothetical protein K8S97_11130 [Anaerolineae bacterium]|nr:hypothetical protein [Anaerolineae bacterium]